MRIIDVKAYGLELPVDIPYVWRDGLPGSGKTREQGILRIITDEGLEGIAVTGRGAMTVDYTRRCFKELLIGKDPLMKEQLWHEVWELDRVEELQIYYMGLIDNALWDLTSKKAGLPLYQLLGGSRNRIQAYASTVTYATIDEYLRIADYCLEQGFRAIKLHAWGDARRDAELGYALRKHVGDAIPLMYDGSAGFRLQDAVYLGKALEDAGFLWYEEPMKEANIWQYKKLCDELTIPVLAAETSDGCHYNAADFIVQGACDMIRTGTGLKGGITGGLRIAHLADAFNMKAEVHGSSPANLQLACAIPNNSMYEILVWGTGPVGFSSGFDSDGFITVPDKPGLGFEFDWNEIEKKAIVKI